MERGSAGTVDVVDDEHDWCLRGKCCDPARGAAEHVFVAEQAVGRLTRGQCVRDGAYPPDVGRHIGKSLDDRGELFVGQAQCRFGDGAGDRVERGCEHVVNVNRKHDRVTRELTCGVQEEARLADSRRAFHEHEPHVALDCFGETGPYLPALGVSTDEGHGLGGPGRKRCQQSGVGGEQARILIQDAALELLYLHRGIQSDLVAQRLAECFTGPHRFGLPARAIQRDDLLRPEVLAERLGRNPRVDVT